jgi:hypothetical protein
MSDLTADANMTIYTQVVTAEQTSLTQVKSPALPLAPVQYTQQYQDQLNNILRLYFNQIDTLIGQLRLDKLNTLGLPYGSFADTTTQTALANTATVMTLNTTDFASGVSIVTSGGKASRITAVTAGIYNFQWSGQFQNADNQLHDVSVWVRKNGTDVVGSTGLISVPNSHGGVNGHTIAGWNFFFSLAANDYIELWWSTDSTQVTIQAYPVGTSPTRPSTSSLVATMAFVSALP